MKSGGTRDMASGQIVAYKRSWSESLKGRETQTVKTANQPLFLYSRIRQRDDQERMPHDVGSIAYLRSKTVQSMGGSSTDRVWGLGFAARKAGALLPGLVKIGQPRREWSGPNALDDSQDGGRGAAVFKQLGPWAVGQSVSLPLESGNC
jgi:hypothetical protein